VLKLTLKLLAPYIAVAIFWCVLENAWLAILAYHIQILIGSRRRLGTLARGGNRRAFMVTAIPSVLVGPLLYFLLPSIASVPVAEWLARYHLAGLSFVLMIPYFGVIHPMLEQMHWSGLRERSPGGHAVFAGYHVIVLYTLLPPLWLALSFAVLVLASAGWQRIAKTTGGLAVPCVAHVLADLGIIFAAWALVG
jgi:hypothetical protein